ncbi:MAG: GNAT family N-acyltransferase [Saprospiraceae bacterium]|nr:GNAT family N-acyltransferase [Saprospiraceae bacterium]
MQQAETITPVALPVDPAVLVAEVDKLRPTARVLEQAGFEVYLTPSSAIPEIMQEIGRLREVTFRSVGEGTGKERDLDTYDTYYLQLFIWDVNARQLVGGYRIGPGREIFAQDGVAGFYISSLFHIAPPFGEVLRQSVELGRSFVIESYQKKRLPLFLLWKGILFYLLQHPHYRYLIGPVSVSKYYSDISKSLIIGFVRKHYFDEHHAVHITPRKPFAFPVDLELIEERLAALPDLEALENMVETIEPNHFKLPVLLKQYIRQNARFIGFNLDPNFNDALDGLMLLDLMHVRQETIENLKKSW